METPKQRKPAINAEHEMEMSCSENDFLVLKEIRIENNATGCLDESPYLKSLKPTAAANQVFKLSRKRLQCETESPKSKSQLSNNLFKSKFIPSSPIVQVSKKWRSASYDNPVSKISPMKVDHVSPLRIDGGLFSKYVNEKQSNEPSKSINESFSTETTGVVNTMLFEDLVDNIAATQIGAISPANDISSIITTVHSTSRIHQSISDHIIKKPDQHLCVNLLGDYSNTYALPLISGRHKDLNTITPETLANLMNGDLYKSIQAFTIVDARYPYEYEGGHIDGAINIYHKEEINKYFFGVDRPTLATDKNLILDTISKNVYQSSATLSHDCLSAIKDGVDLNKSNAQSSNVDNSSKARHAIIFHCEFSSERGPAMCRYLRKIDRELNEHCYPNLYYPEIYLLHGGYKLFFEKFKNLCYQPTYLPMHSSDHKQDLIKFRVKSKSWNCERKWRASSQS